MGGYRASAPSSRPASRTTTRGCTRTNVVQWGGDYVSYTTATALACTTLRRGRCSRRRYGSGPLWCIVRADARAEDGELNHLEGIGARGADIWYLYFIGDAGLRDGRGCSGSAAASACARIVRCTLTKMRCTCR